MTNVNVATLEVLVCWVLIKRVRAGTECAIGEEQCGFRLGRGCMDQVVAVTFAGLLYPSRCLWNDLSDPVFDGVGLAGFKSRANAFLLA